MKLTETEITTVVYEKHTGEKTSRVIIPTSVPGDIVRAIDVSDLNPAERAEYLALYEEYKQYKSAYIDRMFNFETWVEHTHNRNIKPTWRAFKVAGLR